MLFLRLIWAVVHAFFAKRADLVVEMSDCDVESIHRCAPQGKQPRRVDKVFGRDSV